MVSKAPTRSFKKNFSSKLRPTKRRSFAKRSRTLKIRSSKRYIKIYCPLIDNDTITTSLADPHYDRLHAYAILYPRTALYSITAIVHLHSPSARLCTVALGTQSKTSPVAPDVPSKLNITYIIPPGPCAKFPKIGVASGAISGEAKLTYVVSYIYKLVQREPNFTCRACTRLTRL